MNSSSHNRLALVLSLIGMLLAALALQSGLSRQPVTARAVEPSGAPDGELARRAAALDTQVTALRAELVALRADLERGIAQAARPPSNARESLLSPATALGASDSPAAFELRRRLIRGFDALGVKDRKDALKELANLARWGDGEARALLLRSLGDASGTVRARALEQLAALDGANLGEHLRATLHDPSAKVREVVARRLDRLPAEEAGPMLVDLLDDPQPKVVLEAIQSIEALKYEAALPFLAPQLDSESLEVATHAARALVKLGDAGAAQATIERVMKDYVKDNVSGRVNNVKRLRRLRAVNELESILASDASLAVREEARAALARIEN